MNLPYTPSHIAPKPLPQPNSSMPMASEEIEHYSLYWLPTSVSLPEGSYLSAQILAEDGAFPSALQLCSGVQKGFLTQTLCLEPHIKTRLPTLSTRNRACFPSTFWSHEPHYTIQKDPYWRCRQATMQGHSIVPKHETSRASYPPRLATLARTPTASVSSILAFLGNSCCWRWYPSQVCLCYCPFCMFWSSWDKFTTSIEELNALLSSLKMPCFGQTCL